MPNIGPHEHDHPPSYFCIDLGRFGRPKDVAHLCICRSGKIPRGGLQHG